jgi:hypothetical protein
VILLATHIRTEPSPGPYGCDAPGIFPIEITIPDEFKQPFWINITGGVDDDLLLDGTSVTLSGLDPGPYYDTIGLGCIGAHGIGSSPGPYQDCINGGISIPMNKRTFTLALRDTIGGNAVISIEVRLLTCPPTYCLGGSSISSESSSSSSSCECKQATVELTTTGCCLYLGSDVMEAVGSGEITATLSGPDLEGCPVTLILNGQSSSTVSVEDGDEVTVELQTDGNCSCCKTKSECSSSPTSLWVQKSNKDRSTISLDKRALMAKLKMAARKVRGSDG